jgi:hypothetical protein
MNHSIRLIAVTTLLLLSACAAPPSQSVPLPSQDVEVTRPDLARLYVVRSNWQFQRRPIRVLEQDKEIGLVTHDTYLCWERPGGRLLGRAFYEAGDPGRGLIEGIADFNCAAGGVYYYDIHVGTEDGKPEVRQLDAAEGKKLVAARKPAGKP